MLASTKRCINRYWPLFCALYSSRGARSSWAILLRWFHLSWWCARAHLWSHSISVSPPLCLIHSLTHALIHSLAHSLVPHSLVLRQREASNMHSIATAITIFEEQLCTEKSHQLDCSVDSNALGVYLPMKWAWSKIFEAIYYCNFGHDYTSVSTKYRTFEFRSRYSTTVFPSWTRNNNNNQYGHFSFWGRAFSYFEYMQ